MHDGNHAKIQAISEEKLDGAIKCTFRTWRFSGEIKHNGILTPRGGKFVYKGVLVWREHRVLGESFE